MELPFRAKGDEMLAPGKMLEMRARWRRHAERHDLASVAAYAFDHRTRMLPFWYVDRRMSPGGVRAIGSAFLDAGFEKTRVVLQTWKRNFRPSLMRLDGRIPDLFMVSSMMIHGVPLREMLRDVGCIDPKQRPLVISGGSNMYYEPWNAFSSDPEDPWQPDVVVTGELYVLMEFMDVLLTERSPDEPLRQAFLRGKERGLFDHVPGLVYPRGEEGRLPEELVDTGIQQLLQDMDELPHPVLGYRLIEPPGRSATLAAHAIDPTRVKKFTPIASLEMTYGCKFRCKYCPIPAFNQHKYRGKSPARIADEMKRLSQEYGFRLFFGADDNFFNEKERTISILEELAETKMDDGTPLGKSCHWGTEVTVHDTLQLKDHLRRGRDGGLRALWLGVEDMTATFVKKGQTVDKTREAFQLIQRNGIHPMPMLMHDDSQPLVSFKSARGLLNQVHLLRQAGAMTVQVLMLSPAPGTVLHEDMFRGLAFESVNGQQVSAHQIDGNNVIASRSKRPWVKQLNLLWAYLFFYNPARFLWALVRPKNRRGHFADAGAQIMGMTGVLQNIRRLVPWAYHLLRGRIVRYEAPIASPFPMRSVDGEQASHALPNQEDFEAAAATARSKPEPVEAAR